MFRAYIDFHIILYTQESSGFTVWISLTHVIPPLKVPIAGKFHFLTLFLPNNWLLYHYFLSIFSFSPYPTPALSTEENYGLVGWVGSQNMSSCTVENLKEPIFPSQLPHPISSFLHKITPTPSTFSTSFSSFDLLNNLWSTPASSGIVIYLLHL